MVTAGRLPLELLILSDGRKLHLIVSSAFVFVLGLHGFLVTGIAVHGCLRLVVLLFRLHLHLQRHLSLLDVALEVLAAEAGSRAVGFFAFAFGFALFVMYAAKLFAGYLLGLVALFVSLFLTAPFILLVIVASRSWALPWWCSLRLSASMRSASSLRFSALLALSRPPSCSFSPCLGTWSTAARSSATCAAWRLSSCCSFSRSTPTLSSSPFVLFLHDALGVVFAAVVGILAVSFLAVLGNANLGALFSVGYKFGLVVAPAFLFFFAMSWDLVHCGSLVGYLLGLAALFALVFSVAVHTYTVIVTSRPVPALCLWGCVRCGRGHPCG